MKKIGIFFGSDTGNTEKVSKLICKYMLPIDVKLHDVIDISKSQIEQYDFLIFGIPTWYYGELQCDWDDFLPILKTISFKGKIVAFFGCGDQEDYSDYFCDAINEVYQIVKNNNGIIIGKWPNKEYKFQQSKALIDKNYFIGLIIDEDRQKEKTEKRVKCWIKQLKKEVNKISLKNNVEYFKNVIN